MHSLDARRDLASLTSEFALRIQSDAKVRSANCVAQNGIYPLATTVGIDSTAAVILAPNAWNLWWVMTRVIGSAVPRWASN